MFSVMVLPLTVSVPRSVAMPPPVSAVFRVMVLSSIVIDPPWLTMPPPSLPRFSEMVLCLTTSVAPSGVKGCTWIPAPKCAVFWVMVLFLTVSVPAKRLRAPPFSCRFG